MLSSYYPPDMVHTSAICSRFWDVAHMRRDFFTDYVHNKSCELDQFSTFEMVVHTRIGRMDDVLTLTRLLNTLFDIKVSQSYRHKDIVPTLQKLEFSSNRNGTFKRVTLVNKYGMTNLVTTIHQQLLELGLYIETCVCTYACASNIFENMLEVHLQKYICALVSIL